MATTHAIQRNVEQPLEHKGEARTFVPNVDMVEASDEYRLYADMPGATAESLDINCERGMLTVHACIPPRQTDEPEYLLREYGVGDYHCEFRMGEDIDTERITAEVATGVLTLHLPKRESAQRRRIEITSK
ncbi:MAG: Hsp20/alpha crystallin family protein, partial [Phycisphaerae bacterium]|nr:Hsp20/alpha crystallin family protein [Phycisphaerae bacterium]